MESLGKACTTTTQNGLGLSRPYCALYSYFYLSLFVTFCLGAECCVMDARIGGGERYQPCVPANFFEKAHAGGVII